MGCVHTHQEIPAIDECHGPNHQNATEKIEKYNQKAENTNLVVSQTLALRPKQDKIRT
jgi:hypothetical protein